MARDPLEVSKTDERFLYTRYNYDYTTALLYTIAVLIGTRSVKHDKNTNSEATVHDHHNDSIIIIKRQIIWTRFKQLNDICRFFSENRESRM